MLEVASVNHNAIVNVELSSIFNINCSSFVVVEFAHVVDIVMHCSYSFKPFFWSGRVEFIVVTKVHGVVVKAVETSTSVEFVGSSGSDVTGTFCAR